ncbi:MAG: radical SAM family heme chaperone HemW [Clostridia bacterium]|nr:radical SAM family heme chaperone HemW [Clostridia bacterium]
MNKKISIYIHIPFCISKCYYCDFTSYCNNSNDTISEYINAVCNEILQNAEILCEYEISTIYFGGGTPSFINSKYIEQIMSILLMFTVNKPEEITIEINPATLNEEKIGEYFKLGINRVSIGLQSTYDTVLKKIGRKHNYSDFINTLNLVNKSGIKNISVDLMYPLPGLSVDMFSKTIDDLISISSSHNIQHISIYNLEIHEGTKLDFLIKEGYETLVNEDDEMLMKRLLEEKLKKAGYVNYEISNLAKEGFESKHNLNYWNQGEYLGFGVNAASFFAGTRYTNVSDIKEYIDGINSNNKQYSEKIEMDKLDLMKEYIILKLRLKEGFNLDEFKTRFNTNYYDLFKRETEKLLNLKLIETDDKSILLSDRGKDLANLVWQEFI